MIIIALGGGRWGWAQPPNDDHAPRGTVLVLKSGRVLQGAIERLGDSYRVRWGEHGEAVVDEDSVDLQCTSLEEAYRQLRGRITRRSVAAHIALAEWCLGNGMPNFAYDQWIEAMAIQSRDPRLESLQRRIQTSQAAAAALRERATVESQAAGDPQPFDEQQLRRKVRELPTEGVKQYNILVQPMLLSGCATARCHGSGQSTPPLQLTQSLAGLTLPARHSNRNLFAVLEYVDRQQPSRSPLLLMARQPHGSAATGEFPGLGDRQAASLEQWLYLMSQPLLRRTPAVASGMGAGPAGWWQQDRSEVRRAGGAEPIPVNDQPDPFDPDVFNNRYRKSGPPGPSPRDRGDDASEFPRLKN